LGDFLYTPKAARGLLAWADEIVGLTHSSHETVGHELISATGQIKRQLIVG
jgi:hypothetical protein